MDTNYFFKIFKNDIEKLVRNYIFELDSKLSDDDINKFHFDKEWDYVKVYSIKYNITNLHITYQIFDRLTNNPKIFNEPVEMVIDKMDFTMLNLIYLQNNKNLK